MIYEVNRVTAAKANYEDRKSQLPPHCNANNQPPPTCSQRQRTFRARISPSGHFRNNCRSQTTPPDTSSSTTAPPLMSINNPNDALGPPSAPFTIIPVLTSAATAFAPTTTIANNHDASTLPPLPPAMWTRSQTATAPSPRASA
ncbi:hypothetical protein SprV_0200603200 [Sparganum proliferum]